MTTSPMILSALRKLEVVEAEKPAASLICQARQICAGFMHVGSTDRAHLEDYVLPN